MPLVSISHSITWIWTSRYGLSYILILACAVEVFVWWHSREARDSRSSAGNQAGLHQCSITSQACRWSSQCTCKSHPFLDSVSKPFLSNNWVVDQRRINWGWGLKVVEDAYICGSLTLSSYHQCADWATVTDSFVGCNYGHEWCIARWSTWCRWVWRCFCSCTWKHCSWAGGCRVEQKRGAKSICARGSTRSQPRVMWSTHWQNILLNRISGYWNWNSTFTTSGIRSAINLFWLFNLGVTFYSQISSPKEL